MDNNRHFAALVSYARAAYILHQTDAYPDGGPMAPSISIHRPAPELITALLPMAQDFPGCVTRLDPGTVVVTVELAGMARVSIFTDDQRVEPWTPDSNLGTVDRIMIRWEHEKLAGTAVVIGAAGRRPAGPLEDPGRRQRIDAIDHDEDQDTLAALEQLGGEG